MRFRAVIDTNVLVGGLLTADRDSPLVMIVDGMLAGDFHYLLSPALVDEYRSVLLRPRLRKLHKLSEDEVETILVELATNGIWRDLPSPLSGTRAPDPGDDHLWDLLRLPERPILITGDQLLLENPPEFASVLSPRSFVDTALAP